MLKRLINLLFAASLCTGFSFVQVPGQTTVSPLDDLTRVAEQSLPLPAVSYDADKNGGRRLTQDCFYLAQISSIEHQHVCSGNPALLGALRTLATDETGLTFVQRLALQFYKSSSPATPGASAAPDPLTIPSDLASASAETRTVLARALAAEIIKLSLKYEAAWVSGSPTRRIEAEARLRVFYDDLRKALGSKSNLLPADPRACVTDKEALIKALDGLKTEKRYYDYFAALAGSPEVRQTVATLDEEISRLQALIQSDEPGKFHLARGEIEGALDERVWNELKATRNLRVTQERKRVENEWRAKYPTTIIPKDAASRLQPRPGSPLLSELALRAIGSYLLDPVEWVEAESKLLTAYTRARQRVPKGKSYKEWFASLLSSSDLESAILYSKAVMAQSGEQTTGAAPFDPRAVHRRYYSELSAALQNELSIRKRGGPQALPEAEIPSEPEAVNLRTVYTVRLAVQRYSKLSYMPDQLRKAVKTAHAQFASTEFEQGMSLYNDLREQMDKAALANSPLTEAQIDDLAKARAYTLQAFLRLDEVFEEKVGEGVLTPGPSTKQVKTIIATLKAGRPPNNDPGIATNSPQPPPDSPTSLINLSARRPVRPRGGAASSSPSLELTDAIFLSGLNNAQVALKELKVTMARVRTQPVSTAAEKGRLTVKKRDLWGGGINYTGIPLDKKESRLPKNLESWSGFINPRTRKPFDYRTDVKNFRSFAPVGGGVHFGDEATLEGVADLTEYILTYDDKRQALELVGPENRKYSYGSISPQELKALYSFASSGRNAAISVGWTGQERTYDRLNKSSPVLLDPSFVDTVIGQVLFEADSIPWSLDENLPNGAVNPFAAEFKAANVERITQSIAPLLPVFSRVRKFDDVSRGEWLTVFDGKNITDSLVQSIVSTTTLEQARADFVERTGVTALLGVPLLGAELSAQQRSQNNKYMSAVGQGLSLLNEYYNYDGTGHRVLLMLASDEISSGSMERRWVSLWGALVKSEYPGASVKELATTFLVSLPYTTVAVLMDEPTTIQLHNDQLVLSGSMKYRYATSRIAISPTQIVVGAKLPKGLSQVRDLSELTQLANRALPQFLTLYPPLGRTARYAQITAFLRWARSKGKLLAVDFSNLASYPASDRARTPTPDAVLKAP